MQQIYYVDEHDHPTGEVAEKLSAHHGDTRLHAAFSCYVFRADGAFLVTQRALDKKVWPGVWTNSCCGHPAPGETRVDSIRRRLQEELGLSVRSIELVVPTYIYKTPPLNGIVEHEFCPIYVAITDQEPILNHEEVEAYKWMQWSEYELAIMQDYTDYSVLTDEDKPQWSWWCKDQLTSLRSSEEFNSFRSGFNSVK